MPSEPIETTPETDRAALAALYHATGGPSWIRNTKWLSRDPTGKWHGVTTNNGGRVTSLRLGYNGLKGKMPPELGNLSHLEELWLGGNRLSGKIPPELGRLANLKWLYLFKNRLAGHVPEGLEHVPNNDFTQLGLPFQEP